MLNKECIRLVLNLCNDSIVINAPSMLGLWGSPSYHRVVLVLSVSLVSSCFPSLLCTEASSLKLPDAAAPRSPLHCPNEAIWHHRALCLPTQKINFECFPKHACTNYLCVREGELFTKYFQVNASAHVHTRAHKRWPPHLFHIRKCFHVLIRKY